MAEPEGRFYSLEEVAKRFQVSDQTIRRWIKAGKLAAIKPGREYRISASDLETFMESYYYPKVQEPLPVEGELSWPDETFRRAIAAAPVEQLRTLVKALVGNQPAQVLEDFRLDREAALWRGIERVKVFAHAVIVREELIARGDEDPADYLPDLRRHLESLDIE